MIHTSKRITKYNPVGLPSVHHQRHREQTRYCVYLLIILTVFLSHYFQESQYSYVTTKEFIWVAMGDSFTAGSGDESGEGGYVYILESKIKAIMADARVYNLGGIACTSSLMLNQSWRDKNYNVLVEAVSLKPNLVTLWVGCNDVTDLTWGEPVEVGSFKPAKFRKNIRTILTALKKIPQVKILVGTVHDINRTPLGKYLNKQKNFILAQRIQQANQIIAEEAKAVGEILVVDFCGYDTLYSEENWSRDLVHPSHRGYQVIADRWWQELKPMLQEFSIFVPF